MSLDLLQNKQGSRTIGQDVVSVLGRRRLLGAGQLVHLDGLHFLAHNRTPELRVSLYVPRARAQNAKNTPERALRVS